MLRRPPAPSAHALFFIGVPLVDAFTALPSWVIALLVLVTAMISILRIVFPQQSKDRLAWWQGWWNRPSRRGRREDDADR